MNPLANLDFLGRYVLANAGSVQAAPCGRPPQGFDAQHHYRDGADVSRAVGALRVQLGWASVRS